MYCVLVFGGEDAIFWLVFVVHVYYDAHSLFTCVLLLFFSKLPDALKCIGLFLFVVVDLCCVVFIYRRYLPFSCNSVMKLLSYSAMWVVFLLFWISCMKSNLTETSLILVIKLAIGSVSFVVCSVWYILFFFNLLFNFFN